MPYNSLHFEHFTEIKVLNNQMLVMRRIIGMKAQRIHSLDMVNENETSKKIAVVNPIMNMAVILFICELTVIGNLLIS